MLKINRILVAVDVETKEGHRRIIDKAISLAKIYNAELTFLYVIDVNLESSMVDRLRDVKFEYIKLATRRLRDIIEKYMPEGICASFKVVSGRSHREILSVSKSINADIIMIAAKKSDVRDFFIGTTGARVVSHAPCSVFVVK